MSRTVPRGRFGPTWIPRQELPHRPWSRESHSSPARWCRSCERTTMTSRCRGPCTPSTRCNSISLVADGPLIQVNGRRGSSRGMASGTSPTIRLADTTHTCRSGRSESTRRPWCGPSSRTIVPVSAIATAHPVTTASTRSRSAWLSGGSSPMTWMLPGIAPSHDLASPSGVTTVLT